MALQSSGQQPPAPSYPRQSSMADLLKTELGSLRRNIIAPDRRSIPRQARVDHFGVKVVNGARPHNHDMHSMNVHRRVTLIHVEEGLHAEVGAPVHGGLGRVEMIGSSAEEILR